MKAKRWAIAGVCGLACAAGAIGAGRVVQQHTLAQRVALLVGDIYTEGEGLLPDARRQELRDNLDELGLMLGARIRERVDADGNGEIDADERDAARVKARECAAQLKLAALAKFDADFDGTLSEPERATAREAARTRFHAAKQAADADSDGRVSDAEIRSAALSKEALSKWNARLADAGLTPLLAEQEQLRARVLLGEVVISVRAGILERFDADGDGVLSDAERQELRTQARSRGEQVRAHALKLGDLNADGVMSREERRELVRGLAMDFLGLTR
jgi:Ca2+-binding EF-hand superfamily protein